MNIQKLISQVRAAKKRRLINNFHFAPKGGVDVSDEEFQSVLLLLKDLFKCFKANKCSIEVSFYGEIYITLIELGHSFEISISNRPHCADIKYADIHAKDNLFIKLNSSSFNNPLTVSVKTLRKRSEWKHYCASEFGTDGLVLAKVVLKGMGQRVKYYSTGDDILIQEKPTKADILAAIHLGGATLGKSSMLHHLSNSLRDVIHVSRITISVNSIIISDSLGTESSYYFGDREAKYFKKILIGYSY